MSAFKVVMNSAKNAQKTPMMKKIKNVLNALIVYLILRMEIVNVHLAQKKRIKIARNVKIVNVLLLN
jgi:hypothetical protein